MTTIIVKHSNYSFDYGPAPREGDHYVPVKIWATREDLEGQDGAIAQAEALAHHPLAFHHIALMPDFHQGFGMPIGGVMACDGGVIPNAVGVDIGCGMVAVETDIEAARLNADQLQAIRLAIHERVPVGEGHYRDKPVDWDSLGGIFGFNFPCWEGVPARVCGANLDKAALMLGTLGGGNHFIELQVCPDSGRLWLMIHSGSRGIGSKVCNHYDARAKMLNAQWHSAVPNNDLCFLPFLGKREEGGEANDYLDEMEWCLYFAEANRFLMLRACYEALDHCGVYFNAHVLQTIETHHNYAALEHHFGRDVWVHRKGAVKADGLVIIPGSMGTASYIGEGLANPEAFNSCSHGAGRVMGRKEANRTITHEQAVESMKHVVFGVREGDYDEMPMAYKDVDVVIQRQADLVRPLYRLVPLAVVKG